MGLQRRHSAQKYYPGETPVPFIQSLEPALTTAHPAKSCGRGDVWLRLTFACRGFDTIILRLMLFYLAAHNVDLKGLAGCPQAGLHMSMRRIVFYGSRAVLLWHAFSRRLSAWLITDG